MECMCKSLLLISCMFQFQLKDKLSWLHCSLLLLYHCNTQLVVVAVASTSLQVTNYSASLESSFMQDLINLINRYLHTEYERLIRIITYRKPTVGGGEGVCLYLNFIG